MNFLDKATAREQTDESGTKEKESALFEGPIGNITGRYDFEIPFNFSDSSESENKGKKQMGKKTQNDNTSIWLGLLGLEAMPDSLDELKKAYRNACFAFHPDRFTDAGKKKRAEEQLKKISNAFDELSKLYA